MSEYSGSRGKQNVNSVDHVLDPDLSAEARARLLRKIPRVDGGPDWEAFGAGFSISFLIAILLTILHFVIGLSWWWMIVLALPPLIGISYGLSTVFDAFNSKLKNYIHCHCVREKELDVSSRKLMLRTQKAIRSALGSRVFANKSLKHAVEEPVLRRHEWEVAVALREISKLRSEQQSVRGGSSGPMTAAVLDPQRRALTLATDATTSRITALERYASELEMADAAESDWQAAMKASRRNDQYLDLIARTAVDEHAAAEIKGLTEHAAAAAQALNEHLYQASLAAQALVLPDLADRSIHCRGRRVGSLAWSCVGLLASSITLGCLRLQQV